MHNLAEVIYYMAANSAYLADNVTQFKQVLLSAGLSSEELQMALHVATDWPSWSKTLNEDFVLELVERSPDWCTNPEQCGMRPFN